MHIADQLSAAEPESPPRKNSIMPTNLQFTRDELAQLHLLVSQDIESHRIELHHTCGIPYRDCLKQRLAQGAALLRKMNDALPGQLYVLDHQWGKRPAENPDVNVGIA
jgi:hypothetical protein